MKKLLSLVLIMAVLFASVLPANAIGFDAEEKYNAVFVIYSGNSLGSGFSVGVNCIITNAHVIEDPQDVSVLTYDGKEMPAHVVGMDEDQDIAVLAVEGAEFPILEIADLEKSKPGDDVYAIGAPKSMAYTLTKGVISAKSRQIGDYNYIQTDAPINEGNSGGPLLNDDGQVVGMNSMKMNNSEGIGLAIPVTMICDYLKSLNITLDKKGNVEGVLEIEEEVPEEEIEPETDRPSKKKKQDDEDNGTAQLAWAVAGVSIALNVGLLAACVVLLILLVSKKKKKQEPAPPVPQDPSERTDFEIDILE